MKSIYNDDLRYGPDALNLDVEIKPVLEKLFKKYVEEMGYSPREVSHVLYQSILEQELIHVL